MRLVVFGCIWQCFVTIQNSVQNGLNWCNKCRSSCHEVVSEFFTINAPNPPHWTLNSCLCVSRSDWVYFAMFRYYTKLGAKWVELVQLMHKFVPYSRIIIFRKERTRITPLEPNSCSGAFHSVSVHLAMFHYYTELGAKWVELVQLMKKFVP